MPGAWARVARRPTDGYLSSKRTVWRVHHLDRLDLADLAAHARLGLGIEQPIDVELDRRRIEVRPVVELDAAAQLEDERRVALPLPRLGELRHHVELVVDPHQRIQHLMQDVALRRRGVERGVERGEIARQPDAQRAALHLGVGGRPDRQREAEGRAERQEGEPSHSRCRCHESLLIGPWPPRAEALPARISVVRQRGVSAIGADPCHLLPYGPERVNRAEGGTDFQTRPRTC